MINRYIDRYDSGLCDIDIFRCENCNKNTSVDRDFGPYRMSAASILSFALERRKEIESAELSPIEGQTKLPVLEDEIIDDLSSIITFGDILVERCSYWGYYCSKCKRLHCKPHIVMALKSGGFYIPTHHCHNCGAALVQILGDFDIEKEAKCLFCGGNIVNILSEEQSY